MNNNIQEPHCSFEVSKLLKEKGFKVYSQYKYFEQKPIGYNLVNFIPNKEILNIIGYDLMLADGRYENIDFFTLAPTHAVAIEWIRVNFGIHIFADFDLGWEGIIVVPVGYYENGKFPSLGEISKFDTPQESTEAALLYTLQNLIK
jgi:hypothetical protein